MVVKKYEVVISGVAGQFPEADGFQELADKLNSKVDFISCNNSKWTPGELPSPLSQIKYNTENSLPLERLKNQLISQPKLGNFLKIYVNTFSSQFF
jgi:hypothetical protein